jgi:hypothetical protein
MGETMSRSADVLANSEELNDPMFVVGCPRSGTSVLARTIGLSEVVTYFGETKFIPKFYVRRVPFRLALLHWRGGEALFPVLKGKGKRLQELAFGTDSLKELISGMMKHSKITDYDLDSRNGSLIDRYRVVLAPEDLKLSHELFHKYTRLATTDIDKMIRIMFKDFQLLGHGKKLLEKTPTHALYISTLRRLFPKAKICYIVRDGRDVAASLMLNFRKTRVDDRRIRDICRMQRRIQLIDQQLTRKGDPGYYRIEYEDLVTKPAAVIQSVFNFLDVPFTERVRDALGQIKPTPSKWRQLPSDRQKYVEACLGESLPRHLHE